MSISSHADLVTAPEKGFAERIPLWVWLAGPYLLLLATALVIPLAHLAAISFMSHDSRQIFVSIFTIDNYVRLFDAYYLEVLVRTLRIGLVTTFFCFVLAMPLSYWLARCRPAMLAVGLFLVVMPMMVSTVVRAFGWMILLGRNGIINAISIDLGFDRWLNVMNTETAVVIALIQICLPLVVLPMMASIEKIPLTLEEAATNLGATPLQLFAKIIFPLALPGIASGCILAFVIAISVVVTPARSGDEIVVGVPFWPSAEATASIIEQIIKSDLGSDARLQPTGTLGIFVGIDKGDIQVHPEIWSPNLDKLIAKYGAGNGTLTLAKHGVEAKQAICVTKQTAELTGIKTLQELSNPEMAAKFDSDGDGKGEIWIGAPTWSSTIIEQIRARSYGYASTMTLLQAPEDVAMANVDAAVAVGRPVVFFCYQPHHVFKLHEIVVLDEPPHDPANWHIVMPGEDPDWLKKSMAGSAWDNAEFHIGYASKLTETAPRVAGLLEKITFTPDEIVDMTYRISVERKSPSDVAASWIAANEDRIKDWIK